MILISALLVSLNLSGSIASGDVQKLADTQLPRTLGVDSLRWSLAYPWAAMRLPAGATDARLVAPPGEVRPGIASFDLEVLRDGQVLRSTSLALRCERVGDGFRLRHALPAGTILSLADFEPSRAVLPSGARPLDATESPEGMRLRRALPAGAWLGASCVERAPLVRHGESLDVRAETASLRVRFQAVAQQEGALGEVIRARGPRAGALLKVRVLGAGLAELVP